jgi:hypothetical protein
MACCCNNTISFHRPVKGDQDASLKINRTIVPIDIGIAIRG